ncbi:MAG: hypothetical protein V7682_00640 [Cycloclasticus sp.]
MLKKTLMDSWSFFKDHAVAISTIILPIVVPIDILTALYSYFLTSEAFVFTEQIIPMTINIIAYPIYAVGVIFYIASIISGETLDTKSLWKLGAKFWLPYMVLFIIVLVTVMFGFMLLVIPGIILFIRYAFSEFELLLNQSKPLDAMRNSWDTTKEYMWVILGGYAVITTALYVPIYLTSSLFEDSSISYWVLDTILSIAYSVLSVLYTIFAFRVYVFAKSQHNQSPNPNAP